MAIWSWPPGPLRGEDGVVDVHDGGVVMSVMVVVVAVVVVVHPP